MNVIPLTVIGGFLGAGKTTLVNQLLHTATRRYGVLVNDFGAIAIDAALIAARDGDTIALTNGCVCCGMSGDLGDGLLRLAARQPEIDHVIVEASGVSDPWRVAELALVEPGFSLEPIVVVADAAALESQLRDRWVADTVRGQLLTAEVIVLNKADRAEFLQGARAAIRTIRPDAKLIQTQHGIISDWVLRFAVSPRSWFHADAAPEHAFPTWHFVPAGPFDRDRLRALLSTLPASILRVKGFCTLGPEAAPHLLQFASGQWALSPVTAMAPGLVVIGTPAMPDGTELAARFGDAEVPRSAVNLP
ncbi:MAG: CobW family GTP-binding protein [Acetobacteraceae bacterium]|jgi:G3E family GTPase